MTLSSLNDAPRELANRFEKVFHAPPDFLVRAPGRVDVLGAHTDYNDGWVLPAAINREAWLAVRRAGDSRVYITARDMQERVEFGLADLEAIKTRIGQELPAWAAYPAGVAWSLAQEGVAVSGSEFMLSSTVPVGAGLSSSAAVEVAYGLAWSHLAGADLDRMALAKLCQRAENEYVGVNSGLMDQFASLFGRADRALLFDCRTLDWEAVALPRDVALVIADTGTRRTLANSHYNERRADCEQAVRYLQTALPEIRALRDVSPEAFEAHKAVIPETPRLRAAHIVGENARVLAAAEALRNGDAIRLGQLMDESHLSARDLFEASGPELNTMWKISHGHPARLGGRFVGAGWAGCMIFLAKAKASQDFAAFLGARYEQETGIAPTLYQMHAAQGAEVRLLGAVGP